VHDPRPPRTWQRFLAALAAGRRLNRSEAARELDDHCLHSTAAEQGAKRVTIGVTIARSPETVPGAFGPVHCCRYRLAADAHQRALERLGRERQGSA
jgi:hypothetical protein